MEKYDINSPAKRKQFLIHIEEKVNACVDLDIRVRSGELALVDQLSREDNERELIDFDTEHYAEALALIQKANEVYQDVCVKYKEIAGRSFAFTEFVDWRPTEDLEDPLRAFPYIEKKLRNIFLDNVAPVINTKSGESLALNRDKLIATGIIDLPESFPVVVSLVQRFMNLRYKLIEKLGSDFDPVHFLSEGEEINDEILTSLEEKFQTYAETDFEKEVLFHFQKISNAINALVEMGFQPMAREANYPQAFKRVFRFGGKNSTEVIGFRGYGLKDAARKSAPR